MILYHVRNTVKGLFDPLYFKLKQTSLNNRIELNDKNVSLPPKQAYSFSIGSSLNIDSVFKSFSVILLKKACVS